MNTFLGSEGSLFKINVWLQEQMELVEALQTSKDAQEKEFAMLRGVMEEVADQEIEELRAR